jgi:hypothetical protein
VKNKTLTLSMIGILILGGYAVSQGAQKTFGQPMQPSVVTQTVSGDWKQAAGVKGQQALSAHEWTIYVWPADVKGKVGTEIDTLLFDNGKVTSKNLLAQGYPQSNYGLTVNDDGGIVWETMQAKEMPKEIDLAFLRGEMFLDGSMKGTISMQPQKGAKKRYVFATQMPETAAGK